MRWLGFWGLWIALSSVAAADTPADRLIEATRLPPTAEEALKWEDLWAAYPAPALNEALSADLQVHYRKALAHEACDEALAVALETYLRHYPEIKPAFAHKHVLRSWEVRVLPSYAPVVAYCQAKRGFEAEVVRLQAEGIHITPVRGYEFDLPEDRELFKLSLHHGTLQRLAENDFIPALRYLLESEDNGAPLQNDAFKRVAMLYRLQHLGATLPNHSMRLERAEMRLLPGRLRIARCVGSLGPIIEFWFAEQCYQ